MINKVELRGITSRPKDYSQDVYLLTAKVHELIEEVNVLSEKIEVLLAFKAEIDMLADAATADETRKWMEDQKRKLKYEQN